MNLTKKLLLLTAAVAGGAGLTTASWAYWTASGTGSAAASVGMLNPPTSVTATVTLGSGTVPVTWTASSTATPAGVTPDGYYVERFDGATPSAACGSSPSTLVAVTACNDMIVPDGTYTYQVTAVFRSWTAQSAPSAEVTVINDATPPTVTSINRVTGAANPTNAASVSWTVTFSESVSGVDVTDFALARTDTVAGGSVGTVTGAGATWTITATTGTGDGTLGLNLVDDDSIVDLTGNNLRGTNAGNGNMTGQVYSIDKTAPSVLDITRAGANPTNAVVVSWTVTFSESVSGADPVDFKLVANGVVGASITNAGGLSFTVTANTGTGDGTLGLNLVDDDTIVDAAGNKLGEANPGNGNFTGEVYTIDKTAPVVSSINRASASPTNASSVQWTVAFSEAVTGVSASNFALANAGLTGPSITNVSGSDTTWTITAGTGSGSGTLGLNLASPAGIADALGNAMTTTFTGQTYTIDKTAPTVSSINRMGASPTNASGVQWTVTFSELVSGVSTTNFSLANTGLTGPSIASVVGGGTTWTVTASTGTGSGTLGLNLNNPAGIADALSNAMSTTFTGQTYTIDKTAPVVSITSIGNGGGNSKITVNGTAGRLTGDSSSVTIYVCQSSPCTSSNDADTGMANVSSNGTWSWTSGNNGTGNWYATVEQTDTAGNKGTATSGPFSRS